MSSGSYLVDVCSGHVREARKRRPQMAAYTTNRGIECTHDRHNSKQQDSLVLPHPIVHHIHVPVPAAAPELQPLLHVLDRQANQASVVEQRRAEAD